MKNNFFTDVASAAGVFRTMRKSRKDGVPFAVQVTAPIPCYELVPAFFDTIEGCVLDGVLCAAAKRAYDALSHDTKRTLASGPECGKFVERANFFSDLMAPVMDSRQHQEAMIAILHWYQHIKRMRLNGGEAA